MSTKKHYNLTLTREQLSVIQEALEFFSRFSAGQLTYLPPSFERFLWNSFSIEDFIARRDLWEASLRETKKAMFKLPINASLGIGNEQLTEEAKIAYDIYRPILEEFAKEYDETHSHKRHSVYNHPGLSYSKEGRIVIK